MTPDEARAMYRREVSENGETVTLRRINPSPTPSTDKSVLARVVGYAPNELVGGIQQGDRKVIVLAEDVENTGFPVPIKTGGSDKIVLASGRVLNIQAVDDNTRRVGGILIAYEITARG